MVKQIRVLIQFLFGDFEAANSGNTSQRLRQLVPVAREYTTELREFGTLLASRLTEKTISRGLNWAASRV